MLRAALVVSILLASLILLSHSLLQDNAETGVVVPQLIELRVDEVNIIDDAAGDTCSPAGGKTALVTNIEDLDAVTGAGPSTGALAQRWGGRSLQRMGSRTTPSNRRPVTTSNRPWRAADSEQQLDNVTAPRKLPMAGTERPIAPPAPHILPDRNRLEILKKFREVPEGFDNSDLVDPAAVPRRQVTTQRPPPAKSPLANQTPAETLPKQSARTEFPPPNTT